MMKIGKNLKKYIKDKSFFTKEEVHIHIPEGATPKDGPSAGVGMCVALISALTKIPVKPEVAMTGEITLRGEVLPIGGLKEKLLAALRGGIKTVIIPQENEKDLKVNPILPEDLNDRDLESRFIDQYTTAHYSPNKSKDTFFVVLFMFGLKNV